MKFRTAETFADRHARFTGDANGPSVDRIIRKTVHGPAQLVLWPSIVRTARTTSVYFVQVEATASSQVTLRPSPFSLLSK